MKFFIFLLFTLAVTSYVDACSCIKKTFEEKTRQSDVIFVGKVKSLKLTSKTSEYDERVRVGFEIIQQLKGEVDEKLGVKTGAFRGSSCRYEFMLNRTYLVLTGGDQKVSHCSGVVELKYDFDDNFKSEYKELIKDVSALISDEIDMFVPQRDTFSGLPVIENELNTSPCKYSK